MVQGKKRIALDNNRAWFFAELQEDGIPNFQLHVPPGATQAGHDLFDLLETVIRNAKTRYGKPIEAKTAPTERPSLFSEKAVVTETTSTMQIPIQSVPADSEI
jgi:hypothetical protein